MFFEIIGLFYLNFTFSLLIGPILHRPWHMALEIHILA